MRYYLTLLLFLVNFGAFAQQNAPIRFVPGSKQSSLSIRPEIALFSHYRIFGSKVGEFSIDPKPGVSIGYSKRYRFYRNLGFELGIFGGITRFSYTATAPKENFLSRTHTFSHAQSLVNPFLFVPVLLNFQQPLNNKFLLTLYGGANFKAHFMEQQGSGLGYANATWEFTEGEVIDMNLVYRNKPVNTGIILGTGIGRILLNHNVLQLNFWANIGLRNQVEGGYVFYEQRWNLSGEKILNFVVDAGAIRSKGSSVGTELRYTFTGIRKRMKAAQ